MSSCLPVAEGLLTGAETASIRRIQHEADGKSDHQGELTASAVDQDTTLPDHRLRAASQ
jgi:hypothetical protein